MGIHLQGRTDRARLSSKFVSQLSIEDTDQLGVDYILWLRDL